MLKAKFLLDHQDSLYEDTEKLVHDLKEQLCINENRDIYKTPDAIFLTFDILDDHSGSATYDNSDDLYLHDLFDVDNTEESHYTIETPSIPSDEFSDAASEYNGSYISDRSEILRQEMLFNTEVDTNDENTSDDDTWNNEDTTKLTYTQSKKILSKEKNRQTQKPLTSHKHQNRNLKNSI